MSKLPRDAEPDELSLFTQWQPPAAVCPSPDLLFPALEGVLPADVAAPIVSHVESCPLCRELTGSMGIGEAAGPTLQEGARLRARTFPVGTRRWSTFRVVSYAAAAAIALIAGGLVIAQLVTTSTVAPDSTQAQATTPAPAAPPEFVLALNKPVTELPPESLTLRSASPDRYASALERALEPYERGDYAGAIRRLEVVSRDYPARPHPAYYLGLSKLLGAAGDATEDLTRAQKLADRGSSLRADATWYLAITLERNGRRDAASALLTDLCKAAGPRQVQACAGGRALTNR